MLAQQLIVPLRWGFYFNDCTEEECKSWSCHKNQIYKVGSLRSCCFHPIRSHWANMNHTQTLTVAGQKDVRLFERMWSFFVEKVEFPAVVVAMNSTFLHVDQFHPCLSPLLSVSDLWLWHRTMMFPFIIPPTKLWKLWVTVTSDLFHSLKGFSVKIRRSAYTVTFLGKFKQFSWRKHLTCQSWKITGVNNNNNNKLW